MRSLLIIVSAAMNKFRADLIEKAIESLGWSDEMAAAMAGVSKPIIIDLKKGRYEKKTIGSIEKVAVALGISLSDLFSAQADAH